MTRYSTGSIWVRHSCTSEAALRMPCTGSRILPKAEGRAAAACAGAPLRRGAEEPGFFRGGGVGEGSSAKKAELSTSTVRSAALRLLRFTRRRERLESSFIGNLLLSVQAQSAGTMVSTARAGRQVAVWSSLDSQPKPSQMWSGQGESTKRAAPSLTSMCTV